MKIERVTLAYGGTIPTGNYANLKVELTVEATSSDGDTLESMTAALAAQMRVQVTEIVKPVVAEKIAAAARMVTMPSELSQKLLDVFPALIWLNAVSKEKEQK